MLSQALLELKSTYFSYALRRGTVSAVSNISLTLTSGEIMCLRGDSGSGKSTLINLAAGLEIPSQGEVWVDGTRVDELSEKDRTRFRLENIGIVFQEHNLIPQFTALENVLLVLRCQGSDDPIEAQRLLDLVGVGELADRLVSEMSGGQRQRVGVARALAGHRRLLVCDEPTGSLDRTNADRVYDLLVHLAKEHGVAVLLASHDPFAAERADRVVTLDHGKVVSE